MTISDHELVDWNVSDDGDHIHLGMRDADGAMVNVQLSMDAAGSLAMTLPGLIQAALRRRYGDESLRYAYPLGSWRLEQASGPFDMMTLTTPDGFSVCFSMPRSLSADVENALPQVPRRTDLHTPN